MEKMEITITRATISDLPVLADINRLAYLPETTAQFAFTNWPDEADMLEFFTGRVHERLNDADTQVFKAVEIATGKILGFVCWTLERGNEGLQLQGFGEAAASHQSPPPFLNMKFIMASGADIESLKSLMKGSRHYCEPFRAPTRQRLLIRPQMCPPLS